MSAVLPAPPSCSRRAEAMRLIELARGMLTDSSEEIATIYLDHALSALDHELTYASAAKDHDAAH